MLQYLEFFLERHVIIFLALSGALIATVGSYWLHYASAANKRNARLVLWFGYALTATSIVAFIVAGFLSDL